MSLHDTFAESFDRATGIAAAKRWMREADTDASEAAVLKQVSERATKNIPAVTKLLETWRGIIDHNAPRKKVDYLVAQLTLTIAEYVATSKDSTKETQMLMLATGCTTVQKVEDDSKIAKSSVWR